MTHRLLILLPVLFALPVLAQSDTIYGDLTADGIPEMLVHTDHPTPLYDSVEQVEILESATVYRQDQTGNWQPWPAATGYLMHAYDEAGMERFYPRIERGALVLVHGKVGWLNWDTTRRFRWQNGRFELIGYTHSFFDRCRESSRFDYNLSTGHWTYDHEYFNANDELNRGLLVLKATPRCGSRLASSLEPYSGTGRQGKDRPREARTVPKLRRSPSEVRLSKAHGERSRGVHYDFSPSFAF